MISALLQKREGYITALAALILKSNYLNNLRFSDSREIAGGDPIYKTLLKISKIIIKVGGRVIF